MEIGEVERTVLAMLMRVGREALASYLDEKGTGYRGEEIVNAQGETLPYVRDRKCAYRSVYGDNKSCLLPGNRHSGYFSVGG